MKKNIEIEVRFLEINEKKIVGKLKRMGAKCLGEQNIKEVIFYDSALTWAGENKFARVRSAQNDITMTFKHQHTKSVDGTMEFEVKIDNYEVGKLLLEKIGLIAFREQEKRRHSFLYKNVKIDIDTWPSVPTYVEIEGESEKDLKKMAKSLDLNWKDAVFENAKIVIEEYYNIPVSELKHFTFERLE